MRIYIVDRNVEHLENVAKFLLKEGFEVKLFKNIKEFQKEFEALHPDLVICNPIIEGASPYFIVKWVKEQNKMTPIIVYAANPSKEFIILAKKYSVSAFMIFPFKNEELFLRIKKILKLSDNFKLETQHQKAQLEVIKKEQTKNEILMNIDKLPSFPAVIREVDRLINSEDSSAKDFEEVIEKDQVITAKILKIVNSPFYSLARKFTTISESVAYIGLDSLRSIIYSASVSNLLKVSLPTYGYKREQLWKHSYSTAILARMLSKKLNLSDKIAEELFVSGLIHDIGKIVIGVLAKKENTVLVDKKDNNGKDILELEKKHFYFTHEEVGGFIANKWRLPDIHKKNIENHHNPIDKSSGIVALANIISMELLKIDSFALDKVLKEKLIKVLKINDDIVNEIMEEALELIDKIEAEGIF